MGLMDWLATKLKRRRGGTRENLACVHCGKANDNCLHLPGYQIYDSSTGLAYARCGTCMRKYYGGTSGELHQIRSYPEDQRRRAAVG